MTTTMAAESLVRDFKIVFAGSMGAGKTTAIRAISEVTTVNTDVFNNDRAGHAKASTTVAIDYGQITLAAGLRLRLYGTPGQNRFSFMWRLVAKGALGVIILIDNSAKSPLDDLREYLDAFEEFGKRHAAVIGIGRTETHFEPSLEDYARVLEERGWRVPVLAVDVRERDDVLLALNSLLYLLDAA